MADKNNYFYVENYSNNGEMAISRSAFESIALFTLKRVKGVKPFKKIEKDKKGKNIYKPITCNIRRDGRVDLNVDISLKKNTDVRSTCLKIQEEIKSALLLAAETIPFNININVAGIED